jgi:hypothetical protein
VPGLGTQASQTLRSWHHSGNYDCFRPYPVSTLYWVGICWRASVLGPESFPSTMPCLCSPFWHAVEAACILAE